MYHKAYAPVINGSEIYMKSQVSINVLGVSTADIVTYLKKLFQSALPGNF